MNRIQNRWCTGILKIRILNAYLKDLRKDYDVIQYIGIAADEPKRIRTACYPLVEWGMTEKDCLAYCYERGFDWGGLYRLFDRVSCWCCPLQGLKELRALYEHFPDLWKQLALWDASTWRNFRADYSVHDLTLRFELEKQWLANGKDIRSQPFFRELRGVLNQDEDQNKRSTPQH